MTAGHHSQAHLVLLVKTKSCQQAHPMLAMKMCHLCLAHPMSAATKLVMAHTEKVEGMLQVPIQASARKSTTKQMTQLPTSGSQLRCAVRQQRPLDKGKQPPSHLLQGVNFQDSVAHVPTRL